MHPCIERCTGAPNILTGIKKITVKFSSFKTKFALHLTSYVESTFEVDQLKENLWREIDFKFDTLDYSEHFVLLAIEGIFSMIVTEKNLLLWR